MEGWSSKSVAMDVLIAKVEETVKKLRIVGGKMDNLVISGSLLAWFFSAYNQLEARTNELLSTLNKLSLPNRTSILNGEFISFSSSSNNKPNSISKPGPITPVPEARGKKTARSTSLDDTSQQEPKTKRSRTDNSEEGSSSRGVQLDDLIVKVEELVKKLKGVDRKKGLVSGPLLASFMFAHTQLEDWTNQLLSTSTVNEPSHSSSSSPSRKSTSNNSDPNFEAGPITPDPEARGKKTPRPTSPDNRFEEKSETKRARTDQNSGSSLTVPLDDLIVKVKEMVNMLKSEGRLVNGPLLGCFVSAQTLLMACATELLSISTGKSKALHHQGSEVSINYSSTTTNDTAADGSGEKKI